LWRTFWKESRPIRSFYMQSLRIISLESLSNRQNSSSLLRENKCTPQILKKLRIVVNRTSKMKQTTCDWIKRILHKACVKISWFFCLFSLCSISLRCDLILWYEARLNVLRASSSVDMYTVGVTLLQYWLTVAQTTSKFDLNMLKEVTFATFQLLGPARSPVPFNRFLILIFPVVTKIKSQLGHMNTKTEQS